MPWERYTPKSFRHRKLPVETVSVGEKRHGITFGTATVDAWNLNKFKSCHILTDANQPSVVAFQFFEDKSGDYCTDRFRVSCLTVHCISLLKKMYVKPGRYHAKRDRAGLITVDFGLQVKE